jgi:hypothetical protein
MSGFIVMHREALDHPLLRDGERFRAWFWLVANACWKPARVDIAGQIVELNRGQMCHSIRYLGEAWGWPKSNVERFLKRLQAESMLLLTRSKTGTASGTGQLVITICKYNKYQDQGEDTGTVNGTAAGQQWDSSGTNKNKGNKGTIDSPNGESPPTPQKPAPKPKPRSIGEDSPLPEDWEPKFGPVAQGIVDRWPEGMLGRELFAFKCHAADKGRLAKNWDAAFGTWIARSEERRLSNAPRNYTRTAPNQPTNPYVIAALEREADRAAGIID